MEVKNIVIIEDEEFNARLLIGMIEKIRPKWNILTVLESVSKSVEWFESNAMPDLVFMDIQLTDGVSFSIFEKIEMECGIIFTTAYDQYAIQAFKVNSIDYLLKPIKESQLQVAIEKFDKIVAFIEEEKPDYQQILNAIQNRSKEYRDRFLIAGAVSYTKLYVKDIAYFYSENRVTFAVTFDKQEHIINHTIEKIEEQLNPKHFFRAKRSHIVHIDAIDKIEPYFGGKLIVSLNSRFDTKLTISRLRASDFKCWMDE